MSGSAGRRSKRRTICERDGGQCHYCGLACPDEGGVDHVVPRVRGGTNANWNLVWSCDPCNTQKADELPSCQCSLCTEAHARWLEDGRHIVAGVTSSRRHLTASIGEQVRLRYRDDSPYAHLNRAAFPWTYASREGAEAVRQACASTDYIEIYEEGEDC